MRRKRSFSRERFSMFEDIVLQTVYMKPAPAMNMRNLHPGMNDAKNRAKHVM